MIEESDESEYESTDEEDADEGAKTVAARCRVDGDGLSTATVRSHDRNSFTIKAYDADGKRKREGGDAFFVNIRSGGVRLRAKVRDHEDGSYTVSYNPEVSGVYKIAVSLLGESLPGSPFECVASTPTPSAELCSLRGDALVRAVSRQQQTFEVVFR